MITTETGAKKIEDSDNWREIFGAHNDSVDAYNDNIANIREGVAIVVDGDTAAIAVPVGGYAWIRNNTHGLSDGMYKNTSSSAFPVSGGTADSTVFTAISNGAVNDAFNVLNSNIENKNVKYDDISGTTNENGYLVSTIPLTRKVISALCLLPATGCLFLVFGTVWYFLPIQPSGNTIIPMINTTVTIRYYYQ